MTRGIYVKTSIGWERITIFDLWLLLLVTRDITYVEVE